LWSSRDTEGLNSYYLACLGTARLGRIFFWHTMSTKRDSFWYLMIADVLHSILLIAFFYVYKYVRKSKHEIIGNSNKIGGEGSKNFYD